MYLTACYPMNSKNSHQPFLPRNACQIIKHLDRPLNLNYFAL